jgi:hypothetical protein
MEGVIALNFKMLVKFICIKTLFGSKDIVVSC